MAIHKWAVKPNSPRLACRDAAVKVYTADCISPTINTQPEPSGFKKRRPISNVLIISISSRASKRRN